MKAHAFKNWHWTLSAAPFVPVHQLSHFSKSDDAVTMKWRTDRAMDEIGADGKMAMAISADLSGEVTLKLHQTSPSNKVLNQILDLQMGQGQGAGQTFVPIQLLAQDVYRQDRGSCQNGYIKTAPDVVIGANLNERVWVLAFETLDIRMEDSKFAGFATAAAEAS